MFEVNPETFRIRPEGLAGMRNFCNFPRVGAALLLSLAFPAWAFSQSIAAQPSFDAASIRPGTPDDVRGSTFEFPPGGLRVTNGTLAGLIESAYEVRDFQIVGAPGWANSDRFNIVARGGSDGSAKQVGNGSGEITMTRRKLQTLLAQRFHLKVHHETRDIPIYVLSAGKGGPKLKEGKASSTPAGMQTTCGQMTGTSTSIANLTVYLSRQLGRPVRNQTNLTGLYDFHVEWTPDSGPCGVAAADNADPGSTAGSLSGPSLFTAMQEQLGLKLESTKGPVDVIVVESVEKPDEN